MNVNKYTDASIDLETLGTSPTAPIIAIGISLFNLEGNPPEEDATFHVHIDPREYMTGRSELGAMFSADYDTFVWWMKQNDELKKDYFEAEGVDIYTGLAQAYTFLEGFKGRVWAKGPGFDCAILSNAFATIGFKPPWKFWMERDVRTIMNVAGLLSGADLVTLHDGMQHHALDDAISQASQVQMAFASMMQQAYMPTTAADLERMFAYETAHMSRWQKFKRYIARKFEMSNEDLAAHSQALKEAELAHEYRSAVENGEIPPGVQIDPPADVDKAMEESLEVDAQHAKELAEDDEVYRTTGDLSEEKFIAIAGPDLAAELNESADEVYRTTGDLSEETAADAARVMRGDK